MCREVVPDFAVDLYAEVFLQPQTMSKHKIYLQIKSLLVALTR